MLVSSGPIRRAALETKGFCFNLAIEMLVISGKSRLAIASASVCFNLAIEMLVISGETAGMSATGNREFQSRNRDACHFRTSHNSTAAPTYPVPFQSRNREACHFR